jgi:hypothetical protein
MSALSVVEPLRAGIGGYFPLLVVAFIWWLSSRSRGSSVFCRPRGEQPPAPAPRQTRPDEGSGSDDEVTEVTPLNVLRQMLFGGMEMPPGRPQAPVLPLGDDFGGDFREADDWRTAPPPAPATAEWVVPAAPLPEEERPVAVIKVAPPAEQPKAKRNALVMARTPRRELQRAVAWSEVLGPPVGLRDMSR